RLKAGKNQLLVKVCNGLSVWAFYIAPTFPPLHNHAGFSQAAVCVAFTPAGEGLVAGSNDRCARLWELAGGTFREQVVFNGHTGRVVAVACSPDGKRLASGSWEGDRSIKLWDRKTGATKERLQPYGNVHGLAFSPSGQLLAAASSDIQLWDLGGPAP